jgi:hypothetical protein
MNLAYRFIAPRLMRCYFVPLHSLSDHDAAFSSFARADIAACRNDTVSLMRNEFLYST